MARHTSCPHSTGRRPVKRAGAQPQQATNNAPASLPHTPFATSHSHDHTHLALQLKELVAKHLPIPSRHRQLRSHLSNLYHHGTAAGQH